MSLDGISGLESLALRQVTRSGILGLSLLQGKIRSLLV